MIDMGHFQGGIEFGRKEVEKEKKVEGQKLGETEDLYEDNSIRKRARVILHDFKLLSVRQDVPSPFMLLRGELYVRPPTYASKSPCPDRYQGS